MNDQIIYLICSDQNFQAKTNLLFQYDDEDDEDYDDEDYDDEEDEDYPDHDEL